jgi:sec-independent protein translocase protein TatC
MATTPLDPRLPQGEGFDKRSPADFLRALRRTLQQRASQEDPSVMTILEHLEALRTRLMWAGLSLAITIALSFIFSSQLVDFLTSPIGGRSALVSIEVTENINVFMRVSLVAGFALGLPLVLYQFISFITPGLKPRERRWLLSMIPAATLLFLAGAAFAWFVIIPTALPFLTNFLGIHTNIRPLNYFSFVTSFLFWVGVGFETPLVIYFLAKMGLVTAQQLLHGWRYAFLAIATLAAVVTPTIDPVNMMIFALPLFGLYFIGIFLAWLG